MEVCSEVGKYIIHPLSGQGERTKLVAKMSGERELRRGRIYVNGIVRKKERHEPNEIVRTIDCHGELGRSKILSSPIDLNICMYTIIVKTFSSTVCLLVISIEF